MQLVKSLREIIIVKVDKRDIQIVKVTDDNKNDENVARLIDASKEILLQPADCITPNTVKMKTLNVKVFLILFHKKYISQMLF